MTNPEILFDGDGRPVDPTVEPTPAYDVSKPKVVDIQFYPGGSNFDPNKHARQEDWILTPEEREQSGRSKS